MKTILDEGHICMHIAEFLSTEDLTFELSEMEEAQVFAEVNKVKIHS